MSSDSEIYRPFKAPEAADRHESGQRSAKHVKEDIDPLERISELRARQLVEIFQAPENQTLKSLKKNEVEQEFVLGYLPLIRTIARKYTNTTRIPLADLVNMGVESLYDVMKTIDLKKAIDLKLSSYIGRSVDYRLLRKVEGEYGGGMTDTGIGRFQHARNIRDIEKRDARKTGRLLEPAEWNKSFQDRTGMTRAQFDHARHIPRTFPIDRLPLAAAIGEEDPDDEARNLPYAVYDQRYPVDEAIDFKRAFSVALEDREGDMVQRNILGDELKGDIAMSYSLSRERVQQIVQGALHKIRSFFTRFEDERERCRKEAEVLKAMGVKVSNASYQEAQDALVEAALQAGYRTLFQEVFKGVPQEEHDPERILRTMIPKLKRLQQDVIWLHYLDYPRLTIQQIARKRGVSESAIETRRANAVDALRQMVKEKKS